MKIVLATHNLHKVEEMKKILSDMPVELLSLDSFPAIGEIIEDGTTLEENARKKAQVVYQYTGLLSLADDTGLEVDVLGGEPGVYSARYAGENSTYKENNEKLLVALSNVPPEKRTAKFKCVISIIGKNIDEIAVGEVNGRISTEARGKNGFGYDPLFIPDGFLKTYAEMEPELKNQLSHRAKALEKVKKTLKELIQQS
jgi:XTP/dITP diphosphohydrolase